MAAARVSRPQTVFAPCRARRSCSVSSPMVVSIRFRSRALPAAALGPPGGGDDPRAAGAVGRRPGPDEVAPIQQRARGRRRPGARRPPSARSPPPGRAPTPAPPDGSRRTPPGARRRRRGRPAPPSPSPPGPQPVLPDAARRAARVKRQPALTPDSTPSLRGLGSLTACSCCAIVVLLLSEARPAERTPRRWPAPAPVAARGRSPDPRRRPRPRPRTRLPGASRPAHGARPSSRSGTPRRRRRRRGRRPAGWRRPRRRRRT